MPHTDDHNGETQRNRAYQSLRRAILLRQIPEGQRLGEVEWAERLGVNRTAVREACGRLCGEGLVVEGPKRGYLAARLNEQETRDALDVRIMIETGAIEQCCRLGLNKPRHLRSLDAACEDLEWLLRRGYPTELAEADRRFHEGLVAATGNKRMERLYHCVPSVDVAPQVFDGQDWAARGRILLKEHREILGAIRRGRVVEAQRHLRAHLADKPAVSVNPGAGVA